MKDQIGLRDRVADKYYRSDGDTFRQQLQLMYFSGD